MSLSPEDHQARRQEGVERNEQLGEAKGAGQINGEHRHDSGEGQGEANGQDKALKGIKLRGRRIRLVLG